MHSAIAQASGLLPVSNADNLPREGRHILKADQLDYSVHPVLEPRYEYLPVSLNSLPSNAIPIAAQTTTRLEFKLPSARIINFAKSYINYNYSAPAVALNYIWTFEDVQDFASDVVFVGGNSAEVARIDNLGVYSKIVRKIDTPFVQMTTNDDLGGLYRSRKSSATNRVPAGGAGTDDFAEPLYSTATLVNTALDLQRQFKFSQLTGTILGTDRNFYCPADMYLRFNTLKGDNVCFLSTNPKDQAPGGAGVATVPSLTMNNVTLFLAVETNPSIIEMTVASCLAGSLIYSIPYTVSTRLPGTTVVNGQTSLQVAYSNMYGHRLKRIITTACGANEFLDKTYDINNTSVVDSAAKTNIAAKTASYYTSLDNRRLQQRTLSCLAPAFGQVNSDDWTENRRYIENGKSSIVSRNMYSINWFHIDSFTEVRGIGNVPEVNLDRGLDMATPHQWQFNSQAQLANLVHYVFAEFIRPIRVTVLGVELLPYELQLANLRVSS